MYLITTVFRSNEKGIYTFEEETASGEIWKIIKYKRSLHKWVKLLCPYISLDNLVNDDRDEFLYNLIQEELKYLNSKNKENDMLREFTIKIEIHTG